MKTAISIPDKIFKAAEQTAQNLGISRSELYANAVSDYIEECVSEHITEKLNEVYICQESSLDSDLQKMQFHSLDKEEW